MARFLTQVVIGLGSVLAIALIVRSMKQENKPLQQGWEPFEGDEQFGVTQRNSGMIH